jgi:hypothetical protein
MLFQLKKLPEIINLTRFLKSFWILYIDQIIVYNAFYLKLTFYIIKDRCQMHALKVFRSPVWLLLHKLSSPHYRYIRKMWRGNRLPLTKTRWAFKIDFKKFILRLAPPLSVAPMQWMKNSEKLTTIYMVCITGLHKETCIQNPKCFECVQIIL